MGGKVLEAAPGAPALEAPGAGLCRGPWRPLEAPASEAPRGLKNTGDSSVEAPGPLAGGPANPPAAGPSFSWKEQEDDLFEVGIEGVAL